MNISLDNTEYYEYVSLVKRLTENQNKKVFVITFGCQQNEADSETIKGIAKDMGYSLAETYNDADLIILNTCAIRAHAEMKALSLLGNFKALKKKNPDLVVGVCGCMAAESHIAKLIKTDFHYVSFTLEPNMLHLIPNVVYKALEDKKRTFEVGLDKGDIVEGMPTVRTEGHKSWVSIMYGCNNFCTYCIVPYVRGRERSRNSKDIITECRELVKAGTKEITLLGQNVNSYKSDLNFGELVEEIAKIDGDFLIRFMTSHPKDVSDKLIEVMGKYNPKVAPYFHLPLQSGSDKILKKMNRTYDREKFLDTVKKLREAVPNICLSTDVIIGFPGESEEDFDDTMEILERVKFDNVYSFNFSEREGTPAAKMTDKVPDEIKNKRMQRLLELQDKVSLEKNLPYENTVQRVLVDSVSKKKELKTVSARTASNKLVHFEANADTVGEFKTVKIVKANAFDLIAEEIN